MFKRVTIVLFLILALGFFLAAAEYKDVRELKLAVSGTTGLFIDCGAGSLLVNGSADSDQVLVKATVRVEGIAGEPAAEYVAKHLELDLRKKGDRMVLDSRFTGSFTRSLFGARARNARVDLEVTVPSNMALKVRDGSGEISISGMRAGLDLRDGSGAISLSGMAGGMKIIDGSGSLVLHDIKGGVEVDDGSGAIEMVEIHGNMDIRDGSGSIILKDIQGDVKIRDGSGNIQVAGINGSVILSDGSGSIDVSRVEGDVRILEAGSGGLRIRDVSGKVIQ